MSTQIETAETAEQRIERELAGLREHGILKKPLPTISVSTFNNLPLRSQAEFMRAGGKLTDDPKPPKSSLPAGGILRTKFGEMTPAAQMKFIKDGGRIYDDEDYFEPKEKAEKSEDKAEAWLASGLGLGLSADDLKELRTKLQPEGQE